MKIGESLFTRHIVGCSFFLDNIDYLLKNRIYTVLHVGIHRVITLNLAIIKENENW